MDERRRRLARERGGVVIRRYRGGDDDDDHTTATTTTTMTTVHNIVIYNTLRAVVASRNELLFAIGLLFKIDTPIYKVMGIGLIPDGY